MAYLTEPELDTLFTDSDVEMLDAPEKPPSPPTTFPLFTSLPPELRNTIYTYYFSTYFSTSPTIKINASGTILSDSISAVSHQLRFETHGYFPAYLHAYLSRATTTTVTRGSLRIEAQITAYNCAPLQKQLCALATDSAVRKEDLAHATTVRLLGGYDFGAVMAWVEGHLADGDAMPVFDEQQTARLASFGAVGLFSGSLGLVEAVKVFRRLEGEARAAWKYHAREFLELSGQLVWGCGAGEGYDCEGLAKRVFEVIAYWHHCLRGELGEVVRKMSERRLSVLRSGHADMANVVYNFWSNCCLE